MAFALLSLGFVFSKFVWADVSVQVIGGEDAAEGAYPWMGALVRSNYDDIADDQFCGCMLIDSEWVLTAAHCVDDRDLDAFVIAIGDENLFGEPRIVAPKMILVNPAHYNRSTRGGDVALIQLKEPITDIDPIVYRRSTDTGELPDFGRILGWGRTALSEEGVTLIPEPVLQVADVPIHELGDPFLVEQRFGEFLPEFIATGQIDPMKGALNGDSGGPLLIAGSGDEEWVVAGIDSWGGGSRTERAVVSMFLDVSVYSEWIDEIVGVNKLNGPDFGDWGFETGEFADYAENGLPGLRIWPFGAGLGRGFEVSGDLRSWQRFQFTLEDSNEYRFNEDGSVTIFPRGKYDGFDSLFIRKWENSQVAPRSGVFPLSPYQVARGSSSFPQAVFDQNQSVFKLMGIEAGREYSIGAWNEAGRNASIYLYEKRDSRMDWIYSGSVRSSERQIGFTANSNAEYWLSIGLFGNDEFEFELYLQEEGRELVDQDRWHEGLLEEGDSPFRRSAVRMDAFSASEHIYGDVKIEVDSVFDAEMGVYDRVTGERLAYYDQGAENDLETMIVYGGDLYDGDFRIFNFDHGIYGSYRFRYTAIEEGRTASVGVDEQRAVTEQDRSDTEDDGEIRYYEWIDIEDTDEYTAITVVVDALDSTLLAGVYDIDGREFLETDYGSYTSFLFEPKKGSRYAVYVGSIPGYRNANYDFKIVGDEIVEEPDEGEPYDSSENGEAVWGLLEWPAYSNPESFSRDESGIGGG